MNLVKRRLVLLQKKKVCVYYLFIALSILYIVPFLCRIERDGSSSI